jgi:hypothetical protein
MYQRIPWKLARDPLGWAGHSLAATGLKHSGYRVCDTRFDFKTRLCILLLKTLYVVNVIEQLFA